jgi:Protein of unknown function (DUF4038)/Putative collagen-binding domain of a collagenase
VQAGKRYLVGANGAPFLVQGDSPWSLIAELTREQVVLYLNDRAAKKFNTLMVNLIEHGYATNAPNNIYNVAPFTTPDNFSTPNPAYFEHADYVLQQCALRGMVVLLAPAYHGYNGQSDGWWSVLTNGVNTEAVLRGYGQWLGNRYKAFNNIVWLQGGDYNPPSLNPSKWIAEGIRSVDSKIQSAHGNETTAYNTWGAQTWLDVNNVYTYGPVPAQCEQAYTQTAKPFIMIESRYENEESITTAGLRTQAYHGLLSGACGQLYGCSPVWDFNTRRPDDFSGDWPDYLNAAGAQSMTLVWNLFSTLNWQLLIPDFANQFLTGGIQSGKDEAVAALASDGSFAVVYAPSARTLTINFDGFNGGLTGPNVRARWYNPSTGVFTNATASNPPANGSMNFSTIAGSTDWVLLLESVT